MRVNVSETAYNSTLYRTIGTICLDEVMASHFGTFFGGNKLSIYVI